MRAEHAGSPPADSSPESPSLATRRRRLRLLRNHAADQRAARSLQDEAPMQDSRDARRIRTPLGGAPRRGPTPPQPPGMRGSATSPPTPTISAAPRRRHRRAKTMPTCRRPRRNSTGSSRAWSRTTAGARRSTATQPEGRSLRRTSHAPPQRTRLAKTAKQQVKPRARRRVSVQEPIRSASC